MNTPQLMRRLHKWLALIVGVQLLLWAASGFYMVVVDIDIIHGDHLVRTSDSSDPIQLEQLASLPVVANAYPDLQTLEFRSLLNQSFYQLTTSQETFLVDVVTGERLPPLTEAQLRALAQTYYARDAAIASMVYLQSDFPDEVRFLSTPVWRANFDDWHGTSLYIDAVTGDLVTRRHTLWRVFDFMWMLHIMDYQTRDSINTILLSAAAALGLLTVLIGGWLTLFMRGWIGRRSR
ncbi:MAG: PepSY domain-containing protein [Halioglobus sp.]